MERWRDAGEEKDKHLKPLVLALCVCVCLGCREDLQVVTFIYFVSFSFSTLNLIMTVGVFHFVYFFCLEHLGILRSEHVSNCLGQVIYRKCDNRGSFYFVPI